MDIANLRAFVAVAKAASFSAAAEHLHLTQPAVSKRVSALEAELDIRLFDRLGRRVLLTEAGRTLLPRALRILAELEDSRRALGNLSGQVAGLLTVATSHHISLHRLPPVLRRFTSRYPQVQLDIRFLDSEQACAAVAAGDVEVAIVTLPLAPEPPLATLPVWLDQLVVVVSRDHPLMAVKRVAPDLLRAYPAILPGELTFTRNIIDHVFERQPLNVAFSTNYLETIKMMVAVGLGWSLLPRTMLDAELVTLELEGFEVRRTLGAVRHVERTLSNAGQALLRVLQEFQENGGVPA